MADSTRKTTRGSRSRSTSSGAKRSTSTSNRKRTTASRSRSSGGTRSSSRRTQTGTRAKQQQQQQQTDLGLTKGKLIALGATVGGLTGAALLIRKLRSHDDEHDDDEEYDDEEEDEEDEPRSRYDDEDDEDDDYEDDDEEDEDEPQARSSSRSHDDDRGLASTLWDAVVEGVRSSQSGGREKASRGRGRDYDDEEDDDSDRGPRGASKTERGGTATRAPRGKRHREDGEAMDLVRLAKRHLVELTGHDPETVSAVERNGDGGTRVRLEVVELERIPKTTDVLASYELTLDGDGQLVDCTRVGRYTRSNAEAGVT